MALDINGYNATFKAFTDFAQQRVDANDAKAVVDARVNRLGNRKILAVAQSRTDEVHKWLRTNDEYAVNDRTRDLFKKAIVNMFGGESKIPESVKKAMLLGDYNAGKPLTARRILAVKAAIDADGTAAARSARIKLETFRSPEVKTAALGMGYMKSELPKLARAAHFYAEAKGVSEMDAMREVGRPGSEANRLMQYGGRFLESAENFADGLRLIAKFSEWHDGISAAHREKDPAPQDTPSKINAYLRAAKPDAKLGLERFVFEDIASNPAFNLKETDAERAFGVKHNPVSRHMIVGENVSIVGTIANVPPEKRRVVYAAFNAFRELAPSAAERGAKKQVAYETQFLARILRNLPKLEALMAKRPLTGRDIIKTCFPDIRNPGNYDADTIKAWEDRLSDRFLELEPAVQGAISPMLEGGGATIDEALAALDRGKTLPKVPYYSDAQYSIGEASSFAASGIATMNGDINRVSIYMSGKGENARPAFPTERHAWNFAFPDGEKLQTSGTKHDDIPRVGQKIRELCGEVHQKQIGAVAFLLSQSGTSVMNNQPLAKFGINSNEHSPMDFALSRDDATGAVTITYSSPKELPVRFSWTATVGVDGSVKSTPITVETPVARLDKRAAGALVDDAARKLGVNLGDAQKDEAVQLLRTHGTNMYAKNAQLFANFVVRLAVRNNSAQAKTAMAAQTAASIREWRDFDLGDHRLAPFANAAKEYANATIRDYMQPNNANKFTDNIFDTLRADANRATYIFNGTPYDKKPANELIPAFKTLVPDPVKQKAISSWMNQLCLNTILSPTSHVPYETGVAAHELPGSGALVNRDLTTGVFTSALLFTTGHGLTHDLQVSPDGRTATLTQSITADLAGPGANMNDAQAFGQVTFSQRLVIDLAAEVPTVTDYQISQTID